jgi:hypothetical protein
VRFAVASINESVAEGVGAVVFPVGWWQYQVFFFHAHILTQHGLAAYEELMVANRVGE